MRVLIDTNILIPLEPTASAEVEAGTATAANFVQLCSSAGWTIHVHPEQLKDLAQDTDEKRRATRKVLFTKYPALEVGAEVAASLEDIFGRPAKGSNDWIDMQLLSTLKRSAVRYLITEDQKLHRRAKRASLGSKCLNLDQAVEVISADQITVPETRPSIKPIKAYNLKTSDRIFDSLRSNYSGFDRWLEKCAEEHRQAWTVHLDSQNGYAGIAIVADQNAPIDTLQSPCLKICTFKIADFAQGYKLGELLLKEIFAYCEANQILSTFVETNRSQEGLIHLLGEYGFEEGGAKAGSEDELILTKRFAPANASNLDPLEYNQRFGPYRVKHDLDSIFIVPIEPRFHDALFPEFAISEDLFEAERAYGNALRKAYLCNAVTQKLAPASTIIFYRSGDLQKLTTVGIVEDTLRSGDSEEMAAFLGRRTVYPSEQIKAKCHSSEALGILFRHVPLQLDGACLSDLLEAQVLNGSPQSITQIPPERNQWILNKIQ